MWVTELIGSELGIEWLNYFFQKAGLEKLCEKEVDKDAQSCVCECVCVGGVSNFRERLNKPLLLSC